MENLLYERSVHIGILTINRPNALNALNSAVISELNELLGEIAREDIRCLVVTGAGEKAFVAGADISEMSSMTSAEAAAFSNAGNAAMEALEDLPMPTIAAVNGFALGGGCELSLSCDIRLASENAVFGLPEVSLGILPGYGGVQRLARLIGAARAKELAFTGNRIKADAALNIGLVNAVYPPDELMAAALKLADKIAANAPIGVRGAKAVIDRSTDIPMKDTRRMEVDSFAVCFGTDDQREAMAAFVEKRKPAPFTGK